MPYTPNVQQEEVVVLKSHNVPSRFVGKPPEAASSQSAEQWLRDNKEVLTSLLNAGPIPAVVGKWFQAKCVLDEKGLYWSMDFVQDLACEDAAAAEGIDVWDDDANEAFRRKFAEEVRPFRERMGQCIDVAWKIARKAPAGLNVSMGGGERDSDVSLRASIMMELERGEFPCPSCGRTVENRAGFLLSNGWLACIGSDCRTYFVDDFLSSPGLEDGIHRLRPGVTELDLVRELFVVAHDEDSRFHVFGPADDWKAGRLDVDVAVKDGRIVGYATWNEYRGRPALRQIWTHSAYRRRGIATSVVAKVADQTDKFGVESPNGEGLALIKAGGWGTKAYVIQGL